MSEFQPVGFAFVGCGNIAGPYARQAREGHADRVRIVGGFDTDGDKARAFAEQYGCKAYASLDELLADEAAEAALNITTHTAHAEVTRALLTGGKHVHSEKPLATTREDARACLALAAEKGLLFACSPTVILGEAQQTLKKVIADGVVGEPKEVYAEMNHGRIEAWHPDPAAFYGFGAGPLLDVGCYPLSVLTHVFGSVTAVRAMGGVRLPQRTIAIGPKAGQTFRVTNPDHTCVLLEFAGGLHGRLTASFFQVRSAQAGIEIHGTDGSLWLESAAPFNARLRLCKPGQREWTDLPYVAEPQAGVDYARGLRDLAEAIRNGRAPGAPATAAYHVLDICLSALAAAESGQTVRVKSTFDSPE